jgi:hypothetical protein
MILYLAYNVYNRFGSATDSRGVFSLKVIRNMLSAPFQRVTFRDSYATNVLTSFTKVITDSCYGELFICQASRLNTYFPNSQLYISVLLDRVGVFPAHRVAARDEHTDVLELLFRL